MPPIRLTLFHFIIRRLGYFRRFPSLVYGFDVFLRMLTAITAPTILREIRALTRELLSWREVSLSRHRFGGREFQYRGDELGHVHSNGVVDIRLTRTEHDDVVARGIAVPRHVASLPVSRAFFPQRRLVPRLQPWMGYVR